MAKIFNVNGACRSTKLSREYRELTGDKFREFLQKIERYQK